MLYKSLHLTNFTVFKDATFDFVPGVNVLVGANGTGKTHVLKALYCLQLALWQQNVREPGDLVSLMFDVYQESSNGLLRSDALEDESASLGAEADGVVSQISFNRKGGSYSLHPLILYENDEIKQDIPRPVFIPSIDMLAHTRRFVATYDEYKIDFDQTNRDIVSLLLSPEKRSIDSLGIGLAELSAKLALDVNEENERFYITTPAGRFAAPMVAEGIRKIATLVQLIRNGWIRPGTTLLWDEPEVSLNPSLMDELIHALLALAKAGVQVFLATHSYVMLKELDLQAKRGMLRYFGLEPTDAGVKIHPADNYEELQPNKIADQFDSIYDRQLTRATGRPRRGANGR